MVRIHVRISMTNMRLRAIQIAYVEKLKSEGWEYERMETLTDKFGSEIDFAVMFRLG